MATPVIDYAAQGAANPRRRIHKLAFGWLRAVIAWNDARLTRNALARLSNQALSDIGLVRGDIDLIATPPATR